MNATLSPRAQSDLHHILGIVRAQEDDPGVGRELSYPPGGFDSIQSWETDVQQDQVRPEFFGLLNGFQSIRHFADDLPFWMYSKQQTDLASPVFVIICYENANYWQQVLPFGGRD